MPRDANTLGAEEILGHPALTDSVTGLANRLHFELVFRYMFLAGDRGVAFTVMLVSVGDDTEPGPDLLKRVTKSLQATTRLSDLVAHAGGTRFAVLLLATNLPGARIAADRIEVALREATSERVSIGLAAFDPEMRESGELLSAVESALARAEAAGGGVEMS